MNAGCAQSVGRLQGMPALDAPLTLRAVAHLDLEVPNDRLDLRELFLILRRHMALGDRPAAVGTRCRDRRRVRLVDLRRATAAPVPAVARTGPPAGTTTATLRTVLGERGRLPAPGAALGRQLLFQMVVLALQPLDLALQAVNLSLLAVVVDLAVALAPRQLCAQSVELALQVLGRIAVPGLHAKVMPQFQNLYKSKI